MVPHRRAVRIMPCMIVVKNGGIEDSNCFTNRSDIYLQ